MILLDRLLAGGLKFVFERIADAVDAEADDEGRLREELLAAEMRLELGEITPAEFAEQEREILLALRAVREREQGASSPRGALRVTGVEATVRSGHEDHRHRR